MLNLRVDKEIAAVIEEEAAEAVIVEEEIRKFFIKLIVPLRNFRKKVLNR